MIDADTPLPRDDLEPIHEEPRDDLKPVSPERSKNKPQPKPKPDAPEQPEA